MLLVGFWMGLPAPFCQKHLPPKDTFITLETRSKKQYKAKYLVRKTGLSGGWKGFAISERLLVGDVLVFHLISDTKFKEPAREEISLKVIRKVCSRLKIQKAIVLAIHVELLMVLRYVKKQL